MTKYVNMNVLQFEVDQFATDVLAPLVKEETLVVTTAGAIKPNGYLANLASLSFPYRHRYGEEVTIAYIDDNGISVSKRQGVTECTTDVYQRKIEDPFSEHKVQYGRAKPLRLFRGNLVELVTDGHYSITHYHIRYLKEPLVITLDQTCELPAFIHPFIVKQAVDMAIENMGDAQRYQTHSIETKTMG